MFTIAHLNSDIVLSTSISLRHWQLVHSTVLALPQVKGTLWFNSVLQILKQILSHLRTIL